MRLGILLGFTAVYLLLGTASFAGQNVSFQSPDGTSLKGIIDGPEGAPKAVALILQGSGNVGADGDVSRPFVGDHPFHGGSSKLSEQLSAVLKAQGFVSLRFGKRGSESPTRATDPLASFDQMKMDATAAANFLKEHYPHLRFFIVGFSEGSLLAMHLSSDLPFNPNGIFLLSPPAKGVDDWLKFITFTWPTEVLKKVDMNQDGILSEDEFNARGTGALLPMVTDPKTFARLPWSVLDVNHHHALNFAQEILPVYEAYHQGVMSLVKTPSFKAWHDSLAALEDPALVLKRFQGNVWMYHSSSDSQFNWRYSYALRKSVSKNRLKQYVFRGLGHCFSPYEGVIGETKTSGPFDHALLDQLSNDLAAAIRI